MLAIALVLSLCVVFLVNDQVLVSGQVRGPRHSRPSEDERVHAWFHSNNTWPPQWQPETPAFKEAMAKREEELLLIPGANERWENFMQYTQSRLVPRFTPVGFKRVKTPAHLQAKLKAAVDRALVDWEGIRTEPQIDAVYTPLPSKMVSLNGVEWEVINELKEMHEQWSGLKLRPTSAYGIRMYQNGSSLVMHYDKIHSHVISSIIHVAHEYDNDEEPWPIEIEDHDGVLHSYNLEPGELLHYESASCLHGRRQRFKGKYYASIFIHYQPVDKTVWDWDIADVIANVPPHWRNGVIENESNRWAGQGITTDSCVTDGAPARVVRGEVVHDIKEYYARHNIPHESMVHNAQHPTPLASRYAHQLHEEF